MTHATTWGALSRAMRADTYLAVTYTTEENATVCEGMRVIALTPHMVVLERALDGTTATLPLRAITALAAMPQRDAPSAE